MANLDARISALEQSHRDTGIQITAITVAGGAPELLQVIVDGVPHQSAAGESAFDFAERIARETGYPRRAILTPTESLL